MRIVAILSTEKRESWIISRKNLHTENCLCLKDDASATKYQGSR